MNIEHNSIAADLTRQLAEKFDNQIKDYLIKNLAELDYIFNSEHEFLDFCKNRITRISQAKKPYYHEFYLDNKIFVGSYSEETKYNQNGNTINVTIG